MAIQGAYPGTASALLRFPGGDAEITGGRCSIMCLIGSRYEAISAPGGPTRGKGEADSGGEFQGAPLKHRRRGIIERVGSLFSSGGIHKANSWGGRRRNSGGESMSEGYDAALLMVFRWEIPGGASMAHQRYGVIVCGCRCGAHRRVSLYFVIPIFAENTYPPWSP